METPTIAIVVDDDMLGDMYRTKFESAGYKVVLFGEKPQKLNGILKGNGQISLIFTDVSSSSSVYKLLKDFASSKGIGFLSREEIVLQLQSSTTDPAELEFALKEAMMPSKVLERINDLIRPSIRKKVEELNQRKILMFEDDSMLTEMYKIHFQKAGLELVSFEYPPDNLIDVVTSHRPGMVIMSVIMPYCDGFTAAETLANEKETRRIPLVFLTTLGQPEDVERGLALGAVDYWIKAEHTPDDIVTKCVNILAGKRSGGTALDNEGNVHELPVI